MSRRKGFSQIDVVVSLAMGAIVSAMALPAVQQVREKSNREACVERLTRFTMATLDYQDVNGKVPPLNTGIVNDFPYSSFVSEHQLTGSIAYLLPFLDQQELFEMMPAVATQPDVTLSFNTAPFTSISVLLSDPDFARVYNAQIPEWICPANQQLLNAPVHQVIAGAEFNNFEFNGGTPGAFTLHSETEPPTVEFGRTSYLPVMGSHGQNFQNSSFSIDFIDTFGPFRNRESSIATTELGDGASNTLCWSESLGTIVPVGSTVNDTDSPLLFSANSSIFHAGFLAAYMWGFADQDLSQFLLFGNAEQSVYQQVGSNHPGGNNVSFCDGSVKFLSDRINRQAYTWLGAGNDGFYTNRE